MGVLSAEVLRGSFWYARVTHDERALIVRLRDLAFSRVCFGYRRLTILFKSEGWAVGIRRVYRLYRTEGLMVRTNGWKTRASHLQVPLATATASNQRWSMDFVTERLENGMLLPKIDPDRPIYQGVPGLVGRRVADGSKGRLLSAKAHSWP